MTPLIAENQIATIPEKDQEVMTIVDAARSLTIKSNDDYLFVDQFCVKTAALKKRIVSRWEKAKKAAKAAHAAICDSEGAELDLAEEAYSIAKGLKIAWEDEQEKLRKIEEERLRAEAQKIAESQTLQIAAEAEKAGDIETANAIINQPVIAQHISVGSFVPKTETRSQTRWGATITDPMFVSRAIESALKALESSNTPEAKNACEILRRAHVSSQYMAFDQVKLNRQAVATKDALKVDGVQFSSRKV